MRERQTDLARDLLSRGYLFDPAIVGNGPILIEDVEGLCPVKLAVRLQQYGMGDPPPEDVQREGAKVALAALDRSTVYQSRDLADSQRERMAAEFREAIESGAYVSFRWLILIDRPSDWRMPPDPGSLKREDMERFTDPEDYKTIVLYHLGGLADIGALRPIIPQPEETGDITEDRPSYWLWMGRFLGDDPDELSSSKFDPDNAEEMLAQAEAWFCGESDSDNDDGDQDTPTDDPFRSPEWFGAKLANRLRKAAAPDRKTKRVRSVKHDGVKLYSVNDARKWWPNDVPALDTTGK